MLKPIISLIIVLLSAPFSGLRGQEFSLDQAKQFAVQNHYKVLNSDLDMQIAKKKIWETTAIGLPQANASLGYRNALDLEFDFPDQALQDPNNQFLSIFAADNVTQGKVEVTQLLFDGSYIVGLKASKVYYQLRENQKAKTLIDVKKDVANAYYLVLIAQENVKILTKSQDNLSQSLKETKALVEQGFLDNTELDQLQIVESKLKTTLRNAERNVEVASLMLKLNMGYDVDSTLRLSDKLDAIITNTGMEAILSSEFNAQGNVELQVLNTQRKLLDLDVRRYKMQRLPSLAAYYQYQNTAYQLEFDWYKNANWLDAQNLGISLNIPIWSSGMQGAKIKQAKLELNKMDNTVAFMESALQVQFKNALNSLTSKIENYYDAKNTLEVAQKIYDRAVIKQKEGLTSSFEVSQLNNQLLESQGAYINSIFDLLNSKLQLDQLQNKL